MTSRPRTARERVRTEITAEIVRAARKQLGTVGPAELSLRAVARDVGMVSSAVYRYFPSRDDLLTALLISAYDELGTAVESADAGVRSRSEHARRFRASARTIRSWAVDHPNDYALLYGSPVHGYAAPQDTVAAASRTPRVLIDIVMEAHADNGAVLADSPTTVSRRLHRAVAGAREFATHEHATRENDGPSEALPGDDLVIRTVMAWTTIVGTVSFELFGHLFGAVNDHAAYLDGVIDRLVADLGL